MNRLSPPTTIAFWYAVIGCAWILGGDVLADMLFSDDVILRENVEVYKGLLYVTLTTLAVYGFARWQWRERDTLADELASSGDRVIKLSNRLSEREALLVAMLNSISDHVYVIGRDRKLVTANAPAVAAFGLDPSRIKGLDFMRLSWPEATFKMIDLDCDFVLSTGHTAYRTITIPTTIGLREYAYTMTPIFGAGAKPEMAVIVARDLNKSAQNA